MERRSLNLSQKEIAMSETVSGGSALNTISLKLYLPDTVPDAAVTADSILSPAASWVFKRTIPEVPAADKLPEILAKSKKSHRQFVILTGSPEQTVKLPPHKTIVRSGRLTAVIYGDD